MELPAHRSLSWNTIKRSHFFSPCPALEGTSVCERGDSPSSIIYRKHSCFCDFRDRLRKPSRAAQRTVVPLPNYHFLILLSLDKQCFLLSILPGSFPYPSSVYMFFPFTFFPLRHFLPLLFLPLSYSLYLPFSSPNLLSLLTFVPLSCHFHFPHLTSSPCIRFHSPVPSIAYPLIPPPLVPSCHLPPKKETKGEEGGMKQEERDIHG